MDLLISILSYTIQSAVAGLGLYLTVYPLADHQAKHKKSAMTAIVVLWLLGLGITAFQQHRSGQSQNRVEGKLNTIDKNTKTPPTVQVTNNVPPAQILVAPPAQPTQDSNSRQRHLSGEKISDFSSRLPDGDSHCVILFSPDVSSQADREERKIFAADFASAFRRRHWGILHGSNSAARRDFSGIILYPKNPPSRDDFNFIDSALSGANIKHQNTENDPMGGITIGEADGAVPIQDGPHKYEFGSCPVLYIGERSR